MNWKNTLKWTAICILFILGWRIIQFVIVDSVVQTSLVAPYYDDKNDTVMLNLILEYSEAKLPITRFFVGAYWFATITLVSVFFWPDKINKRRRKKR